MSDTTRYDQLPLNPLRKFKRFREDDKICCYNGDDKTMIQTCTLCQENIVPFRQFHPKLDASGRPVVVDGEEQGTYGAPDDRIVTCRGRKSDADPHCFHRQCVLNYMNRSNVPKRGPTRACNNYVQMWVESFQNQVQIVLIEHLDAIDSSYSEDNRGRMQDFNGIDLHEHLPDFVQKWDTMGYTKPRDDEAEPGALNERKLKALNFIRESARFASEKKFEDSLLSPKPIGLWIKKPVDDPTDKTGSAPTWNYLVKRMAGEEKIPLYMKMPLLDEGALREFIMDEKYDYFFELHRNCRRSEQRKYDDVYDYDQDMIDDDYFFSEDLGTRINDTKRNILELWHLQKEEDRGPVPVDLALKMRDSAVDDIIRNLQKTMPHAKVKNDEKLLAKKKFLEASLALIRSPINSKKQIAKQPSKQKLVKVIEHHPQPFEKNAFVLSFEVMYHYHNADGTIREKITDASLADLIENNELKEKALEYIIPYNEIVNRYIIKYYEILYEVLLYNPFVIKNTTIQSVMRDFCFWLLKNSFVAIDNLPLVQKANKQYDGVEPPSTGTVWIRVDNKTAEKGHIEEGELIMDAELYDLIEEKLQEDPSYTEKRVDPALLTRSRGTLFMNNYVSYEIEKVNQEKKVVKIRAFYVPHIDTNILRLQNIARLFRHLKPWENVWVHELQKVDMIISFPPRSESINKQLERAKAKLADLEDKKKRRSTTGRILHQEYENTPHCPNCRTSWIEFPPSIGRCSQSSGEGGSGSGVENDFESNLNKKDWVQTRTKEEKNQDDPGHKRRSNGRERKDYRKRYREFGSTDGSISKARLHLRRSLQSTATKQKEHAEAHLQRANQLLNSLNLFDHSDGIEKTTKRRL